MGQVSNFMHMSYKKLYEFLNDGFLSDITIISENKTFRCHRIVLAACSPFFRAKFSGFFKDSTEKVVTIKHFSEMAIDHIIKFAYTGKIDIDIENVEEILKAASFLQIEIVVQMCERILKRQLSFGNCLGIRDISFQHGLLDLFDKSNSFVYINFKTISFEDEFLKLDLEELKKLISSEDVLVESELDLCNAVLRWLDHDSLGRGPLFPQILSKIRLPLLPYGYLRNVLDCNKIISENIVCCNLVKEAKAYLLWVWNHRNPIRLLSEKTRPRKSSAGFIFYLGAPTTHKKTHTIMYAKASEIKVFSLFNPDWISLYSRQAVGNNFDCICIQGRIIIMGTSSNNNELTTYLYSFDPVLDEPVRPLPSLIVARECFSSCTVQDSILIFGGKNNRGPLNSVEKYDPETLEWSIIAIMRYCMGEVAIAKMNGSVFIFGGNSKNRSLNCCERFDLSDESWKHIAPMKYCRHGAKTAKVDGYIYVFGGFWNEVCLSTVERYDPSSNTWTYVSPMIKPRANFGIARLGNLVYVIGGQNTSGYLDDVEVYNCKTDRWEKGPSIKNYLPGSVIVKCYLRLQQIKVLYGRMMEQVNTLTYCSQ
ncbi:kelch-like protein 26 [Caerostris darwini]|uniref:Kelch-like protein diablo n=1 Tax=Caerostris darwini TaxID=1538125 RepID=A0AAV4RJF9_9ARAC|nr:kelch-like protein 26 [Caerostris darwini]